MRKFVVVVGVSVLVSATAVGAVARPSARTGHMRPSARTAVPRQVSPDFDGDGKSDLAIGTPDEGFFLKPGAGEVDVHYFDGSPADQQLDENRVGGDREKNDHFGASLAPGDFDGNGKSDLAIGTTGEDVGSVVDAGAVRVAYGAAGGLAGSGAHTSQTFTQDTTGVGDAVESGDQFGSALIAGDFNGDGFDDLAIGTSFENIGTSTADVGTVQVLFGSASGLRGTGSQQLFPSTLGLSNVAGNRFGFAVGAGNFGNTDQDDLAIGIPLRQVGTFAGAGAVSVVYGTITGLAADGSQQFFTQDSSGILDQAEAGDHFGSRFAVGDFGKNGKLDLAIGVPLEDVSTVVDGGGVNILYGTAGGLKSNANQFFTENNIQPGSDPAETGDQLGFQLAAGNFDGLLKDDLAVAANLEDAASSANKDVGQVATLYGTASGLTATGGELIQPFTTAGAQSGTALAAGLFLGGDALADLAIASSLFAFGDGAVRVTPGSITGIQGASTLLTQSILGGSGESGDHFGAALSRSR